MLSSVAVINLVCLAYFGAIVDASNTDCPTPATPENGEYFFSEGGTTVKYSCNPGYRLVGKVFAYCRDSEWTSAAPQCLSNNAVIGDLVASYDYTCYQADERGIATLIAAPIIPNAASPTYYRARNPSSPNNVYLSVVYRCKTGYRMRDPGSNTLHCSQRFWVGERPVCDFTVHMGFVYCPAWSLVGGAPAFLMILGCSDGIYLNTCVRTTIVQFHRFF